MITLYEILEVSENASNEVIEKAYKVLAKRYHPDLQLPENKAKAETKMKEINEAYEILSNEEKRKQYDETLRINREQEEMKKQSEYESKVKQENPQPYTNYETSNNKENNYASNNYQENIKNSEQQYTRTEDMQRRRYEEQLRREHEKRQRQMEQNMQQEYENAYYNYLRSLGYRIKERWTWQKTKNLIITILIMIVIALILWFLPPTHNMMVNFYENNAIVKVIVDIIVAIVSSIWEMITGLFVKN